MTSIDPTHVRAEIERLRRLQRTTVNGRPHVLPDGATSALDTVEKRLLEAVRRDLAGDSTVDGYPTGSLSNGGENAAQSSTEGAALARIDGTPPVDKHHALTDTAVAHLEAAAAHVRRLVETLDAIDRLATIHRQDPSGYCNACGRWVEGTSADRLRSGYCDTDYRAWLRAGRPDRFTFERQRQAS